MSAVIGHHLVRSTASLRATDVGPQHQDPRPGPGGALVSDYSAPTPGQLDIFGREVSIEEARQISAALPIDHDRYEHTTALHDAGLSWLQADTLALIDHGYCEVAKEREHE